MIRLKNRGPVRFAQHATHIANTPNATNWRVPLWRLRAGQYHLGPLVVNQRIAMKRLLWALLAALIFVQMSSRGATASPATEGSRANILWIMADQFRADCLGANGNQIIKTPNLDRLAAESANLTSAFVQSPVCVPSRASYFTGRYPHSHRNRVNYTPLKADEILLPKRLQMLGYKTALVGKTHLYYDYPPTQDAARRTGFDLVDLNDGVSGTDPYSDYVTWRNQNDPQRKLYYRRLARTVPELLHDLPSGGNPNRIAIDARYTDTAWTGLRTRERLKELAAKGKPFFLFSSYWKPHGPYGVPAPYDAMYSNVDILLPKAQTLQSIEKLPPPLQKLILRGPKPEYTTDRAQLEWDYRSYYGTISQVDAEIGATLQTLKELGLADNTIVVFCSDHGDQLLEHGLFGKNVFFEASVHVPLIVGFPGKVRPGSYAGLVESVDVLPTLFELAGLPDQADGQGRSFGAMIDGSGRPFEARDAVFAENIIPEVITSGALDFEYRKGAGVKGIRHPDAKMVRTPRWKYNFYPDGYAELYDLVNDPHEENSLADDPAQKPVVDEMRYRLLKWLITADESDQIAPKWLVR